MKNLTITLVLLVSVLMTSCVKEFVEPENTTAFNFTIINNTDTELLYQSNHTHYWSDSATYQNPNSPDYVPNGPYGYYPSSRGWNRLDAGSVNNIKATNNNPRFEEYLIVKVRNINLDTIITVNVGEYGNGTLELIINYDFFD